MSYIKFSNQNFWKEIPNKSGVYFVFSINNKNIPIETQRLFCNDVNGILYIGKSEDLRSRIRILWRVLQPNLKTTAHTFGTKYNNYKTLRNNFHLESFAVQYIESNTPKKLESKLLDEYINKFGEVPPFNSSK